PASIAGDPGAGVRSPGSSSAVPHTPSGPALGRRARMGSDTRFPWAQVSWERGEMWTSPAPPCTMHEATVMLVGPELPASRRPSCEPRPGRALLPQRMQLVSTGVAFWNEQTAPAPGAVLAIKVQLAMELWLSPAITIAPPSPPPPLPEASTELPT